MEDSNDFKLSEDEWIFIFKNSDLNKVDYNGWTPLQNAIRYNYQNNLLFTERLWNYLLIYTSVNMEDSYNFYSMFRFENSIKLTDIQAKFFYQKTKNIENISLIDFEDKNSVTKLDDRESDLDIILKDRNLIDENYEELTLKKFEKQEEENSLIRIIVETNNIKDFLDAFGKIENKSEIILNKELYFKISPEIKTALELSKLTDVKNIERQLDLSIRMSKFANFIAKKQDMVNVILAENKIVNSLSEEFCLKDIKNLTNIVELQRYLKIIDADNYQLCLGLINKSVMEVLNIKNKNDLQLLSENQIKNFFVRRLTKEKRIEFQEKINLVISKKMILIKNVDYSDVCKQLKSICDKINKEIYIFNEKKFNEMVVVKFNTLKNKIEGEINKRIDDFSLFQERKSIIPKENFDALTKEFDIYFNSITNELVDFMKEIKEIQIKENIFNFKINTVIEPIVLDIEKVKSDVKYSKESVLSANFDYLIGIFKDFFINDLDFKNIIEDIEFIRLKNGIGLHDYQKNVLIKNINNNIPNLLKDFIEITNEIKALDLQIDVFDLKNDVILTLNKGLINKELYENGLGSVGANWAKDYMLELQRRPK